MQDRLVPLLFSASVAIGVLDHLAVYPGAAVSVYAVLQTAFVWVMLIILLSLRRVPFSPRSGFLLALLGFLLMSALATPFAFHPDVAFSAVLRYLRLLASACVVAVFVKSFWREEYWPKFSFVVSVFGVAAAFSIISDAAGLTNFTVLYVDRSPGLRPYGILGEPNFAAGRLGVLLPFSLYLWRHLVHRGRMARAMVALAGSGIIVLAMFLTGSRMGAIMLGVSAAFFFLKEARTLLTARVVVSVGLCAVLVAALIAGGWLDSVVNPQRAHDLWGRYQALFSDIATRHEPSVRERWMLAESALRMFRDHPLPGVGLDNYPLVVSLYTGFTYKYAHNTFLTVLAECGVFGFSLFMMAVLWVGIHIYRRWRSSQQSDLFLYMGLSLVNLTIMLMFLSDLGSKMWWGFFVVLGLYWDQPRLARQSGERKAAATVLRHHQ